MTASDEATHASVVRQWWSNAEESLASARREFDAGAYMLAVNRIYYAAFYGVSAALPDRQQSFAKHSGVRAAFHREFIKAGLMDIEWGKFYDHLFEDRQEADQVALATFEPDYVQSMLKQCVAFLQALRPLIPSLKQISGNHRTQTARPHLCLDLAHVYTSPSVPSAALRLSASPSLAL